MSCERRKPRLRSLSSERLITARNTRSKAVVGTFVGDPSRITELDAMVAYLQMLGTLVDFTDYNPELDYR